MSKQKEFSVDDAVREYLPLMHEVVIRIELVAHACEGKLNLLPPYAREYAYLQFRYICELIALGCLQLHGDLPLASKKATQKQWNAEKIMKMLEGDYKHCFPQSVIREKNANRHNIKANAKPNALTLKEFKKLYIECGEVLHRGTVRSIKASFLENDHDYQKIIDWQTKLVDLMNEHLIGRAKGKSFYLVSLKTESGYPECSVFSMNSEGGMDVETKKMNIKAGNAIV